MEFRSRAHRLPPQEALGHAVAFAAALIGGAGFGAVKYKLVTIPQLSGAPGNGRRGKPGSPPTSPPR
jgi:hypothetical protein